MDNRAVIIEHSERVLRIAAELPLHIRADVDENIHRLRAGGEFETGLGKIKDPIVEELGPADSMVI